MLEANRLILDVLEPRIDGEVIDCTIEGRVVIEKGARVVRSSIRGPAIIGAGALVEDAYIGPYSSISSGVVVRQRGGRAQHPARGQPRGGPRRARRERASSAGGVTIARTQREAARLPLHDRRLLRIGLV